MELYSSNDNYKLYQGNMLDMLEVIKPNSIDSIITDPPYGLTSITKRFGKENSAKCQYGKDGSFARLSRGFMGKEWDGSGIEYNVDTWKKCYEVLKDGGYLLAFGGSRTFHRIACAIEDAGFEIRDTIMWLYGSGFPKSMDISKQIDKKLGADREIIGIRTFADGTKARTTARAGIFSEKKGQAYLTAPTTDLAKQWKGWGTALKPSFEPIIVARKPFKGSLVDNVIKNGVGGINIDECRIETTDIRKGLSGVIGVTGFSKGKKDIYTDGRFPANTILTYDETDFEEVCGGFPYTKNGGQNETSHRETWFRQETTPTRFAGDSGSASRYFYCAKASKKDRDEGLDEFEAKQKYYCDGRGNSLEIFGSTDGGRKPLKNIHPTVKPTELMQYLVRLVTPKNGIILDPFNGSGSTGKAVMYENKERNKNYQYIGIEMTEEYLPISKARIEYVCRLAEEEKNEERQLSIYDLQ